MAEGSKKQKYGNRWFFTIKSKSDGCDEYKDRFVAKGYSQIYDKG